MNKLRFGTVDILDADGIVLAQARCAGFHQAVRGVARLRPGELFQGIREGVPAKLRFTDSTGKVVIAPSWQEAASENTQVTPGACAEINDIWVDYEDCFGKPLPAREPPQIDGHEAAASAALELDRLELALGR